MQANPTNQKKSQKKHQKARSSPLKILVVGSGGREHALVWKLAQSSRARQIFCAPGNGGTGQAASNVPIAANDVAGLLDFARERNIDLTIVGPEAPLVDGVVDRFRSAGLTIAGPTAAAARLEGSKVYAKQFMESHEIPTAAFAVFSEPDEAEKAFRADRFSFPVVVKADGLAAGKGVFICEDLLQAESALTEIMRKKRFGESGNRIVAEEFLTGEEASFMVFTDGETVIPMVGSQDHKQIYEGDQGPNTGGMGAFSADSLLSETLQQQILAQIIKPAVQGMSVKGAPYSGILYAGLMITDQGPRVLEFNARFGDPETQVILPRLESDLVDILESVARQKLREIEVHWDSAATVCVVLAAEGYPGSYDRGMEISGIESAEENPGTMVFHAGTRVRGNRVVSDGGRVLGVTTKAATLETSISRCYQAIEKIHFDQMYFRKDIGKKGLKKGI